MASKILLGAYGKADSVHPLEYCLKASGVSIQNLDSKSEEFKLIKEYI